MAITNAGLTELLDAIRSGGDIDVVRRGVEFMRRIDRAIW